MANTHETVASTGPELYSLIVVNNDAQAARLVRPAETLRHTRATQPELCVLAPNQPLSESVFNLGNLLKNPVQNT